MRTGLWQEPTYIISDDPLGQYRMEPGKRAKQGQGRGGGITMQTVKFEVLWAGCGLTPAEIVASKNRREPRLRAAPDLEVLESFISDGTTSIGGFPTAPGSWVVSIRGPGATLWEAIERALDPTPGSPPRP
jgi:hypothetical protein